MSTPPVATDHQVAQALLAAGAQLAAADLWAQLDFDDVIGSWPTVADQLFVLVALAQQAAAADADGYVDGALRDLGVDAAADGTVDAAAFSGVASDGRNLEDLLQRPMWATAALTAAGIPPAVAAATGAWQLARIVGIQVTDAGRTAAGTAIAARPTVDGWVRVLTPPSCSRCVVLAGKFYRWSDGFQRHPHDDCISLPTTRERAGDFTLDRQHYFESLTPAQQNDMFGGADAQAIRDGADLAKVVNAHRGMATAQVGGRDLVTTTTGARGQRRRAVRLMPESIYAIAGDDRAEAIRLLRLNGFLL